MIPVDDLLPLQVEILVEADGRVVVSSLDEELLWVLESLRMPEAE